jgi:hypothetical protein
MPSEPQNAQESTASAGCNGTRRTSARSRRQARPHMGEADSELFGKTPAAINWHENGYSLPREQALARFAEILDCPVPQLTAKAGGNTQPWLTAKPAADAHGLCGGVRAGRRGDQHALVEYAERRGSGEHEQISTIPTDGPYWPESGGRQILINRANTH